MYCLNNTAISRLRHPYNILLCIGLLSIHHYTIKQFRAFSNSVETHEGGYDVMNKTLMKKVSSTTSVLESVMLDQSDSTGGNDRSST